MASEKLTPLLQPGADSVIEHPTSNGLEGARRRGDGGCRHAEPVNRELRELTRIFSRQSRVIFPRATTKYTKYTKAAG